MNEILIVCDRKEIIFRTTHTIEEIYKFIDINNFFVGITDEFTGKKIFLDPNKVTSIQDITKPTAGEYMGTLSVDGVVISRQPLTESYFGKGGIIDSPTPTTLGEAGKEVVGPLENNIGWINRLAKDLAKTMIEDKSWMEKFANECSRSLDECNQIVISVDGDTIADIVIEKLKTHARTRRNL